MKNRTIIGIVCILLALAVSFGITPLVNRMADSRTSIAVLKQDIPQGHKIADADIEIIEVGSYNLNSNTVTDKSTLIGLFAATDLKANLPLILEQFTETSDSANDVFAALDGSKLAMSITIQSFAGGLSGKLQNGDIVSLVVHDNDSNESIIPEALTYVRVITTTTAAGFDKDELIPNEDGTYELPTTLTLLVNSEQAKLLGEYENSGKIHAALVSRGNTAQAHKLLSEQEAYFGVTDNG